MTFYVHYQNCKNCSKVWVFSVSVQWRFSWGASEKFRNPPMLARTLRNITLNAHGLSFLLANRKKSDVTWCTRAHSCNSKVSGQCSTWMIWQLSAVTACTWFRKVHYRSPKPKDVDQRQFALYLTSSSSSQINNHLVFHSNAIRYAIICIRFPSITTLSFISVLCGSF